MAFRILCITRMTVNAKYVKCVWCSLAITITSSRVLGFRVCACVLLDSKKKLQLLMMCFDFFNYAYVDPRLPSCGLVAPIGS